MTNFDAILSQFGVRAHGIEKISAGHIHQTYKVIGEREFILQRINDSVFRQPEVIATNIETANSYLKKHYPDYWFVAPLPDSKGNLLVNDEEGHPWRLFPYIKGSITYNELRDPEQAYSAAQEFGKLTRYLEGCPPDQFKPTIDRFHDLTWRYEQFRTTRAIADADRLDTAQHCISLANEFSYLVDYYQKLINQNILKLRITHNDTKINNVLFDSISEKALAVIDLDTLMPGYFIYDLGDMVRTFVSPANEEEKELSKVTFRKEFYDGLLAGYLSQMKPLLSKEELEVVPKAGLLMTYIMALRFLTDYLAGDTYYQTYYPGQNLVRAKNQLHLLQLLRQSIP